MPNVHTFNMLQCHKFTMGHCLCINDSKAWNSITCDANINSASYINCIL